MPQEFWSNAIFSLIPTVLVGLIFWYVLRSIIRADRSERKAYAEIEAEERLKMGLPPRLDPHRTAAKSLRDSSEPAGVGPSSTAVSPEA